MSKIQPTAVSVGRAATKSPRIIETRARVSVEISSRALSVGVLWVPKTNWLVSSTRYDHYSIMNYRVCWSGRCESDCKDKDGSSPCAVLDPVGTEFDQVIGQWTDNGMSATDAEKVRLAYGTKEKSR